jgi:hypothetical protein
MVRLRVSLERYSNSPFGEGGPGDVISQGRSNEYDPRLQP